MTMGEQPVAHAQHTPPGKAPFVVAIDGPSGSGKSTVARRVAEELGLRYLDTGAMYRGIALACVRAGADLGDGPLVGAICRTTDLVVSDDPSAAQVVRVDGRDVTAEIRSAVITRAVTPVAANPEVRAALVARQRAWIGQHGGGVLEGRDIATVVAPDAQLKVYLTASETARAQRRHGELAGDAAAPSVAAVAADLARRDEADATRAADPLQVAAGAVVLDTTDLGIDEVVARIAALAQPPASQPSTADPSTTGPTTSGPSTSGPSTVERSAADPVAAPDHASESVAATPAGPERIAAVASDPGRETALLRPPTRAQLRAFGVLRGIVLTFSKVFFRASFHGLEHVPSTGAFVVAPTHRSNVDSFVVVGITKRRLRFLGKDSMWKFGLDPAWNALGAIKVARGTPDREAMRLCLDALRGGEPVVVYPEGQRRSGPVVQDLKDGAAYMALKLGVPVLPIGIGGSEAAMGTGHRLPRPKRITIVVGPPIEVAASSSRRAARELTARIEAELQRLFDDAQARLG